MILFALLAFQLVAAPEDTDLLRALQAPDTHISWPDAEEALSNIHADLSAERTPDPKDLNTLDALGPIFADWSSVVRALSYAEAGNAEGARAEIGTRSRPLREAWEWQVERRLSQHPEHRTGSLSRLSDILPSLSGVELQRAAWDVARMWQDSGEHTRERRALVRAGSTAIGTARAVSVARRLSDFGDRSWEENLVIGRIYARHGNYARGTAGLRGALEHPRVPDALRPEIALELADALIHSGAYRDAETVIQGALSALEGETQEHGLFLLGRARHRRSDLDGARRAYEALRSINPQSEYVARAYFFLGDQIDRSGGDGTRDYRIAAETGLALQEVETSIARVVGRRLLEGDSRIGLNYAQYFIEQAASPRAKATARYWAARSLEALGDIRSADLELRASAESDPLGTYGLRARIRAGLPLNLPAGPEPSSIDDQRELRAVERISLLDGAGWTEAVAIERRRAETRALSRGGHSLAESYLYSGFNRYGILFARQVQQTHGWDWRILESVFPFPYREQVVRESRRYGVDPALFAGLIRQESMWIESISSPVGARGLAQVMPATGQEIAGELGVNGFRAEMLDDPDISLQFGAYYLGRMLDRFDGAIPDALAAYNAGPTRARQWQAFESHGTLPSLFIDEIPFRETRGYVKTVTRNQTIYELLYFRNR